MPELPNIIDMLKMGVHFGHKQSKRYPKMDPYIFTVRNNIHIINLEKTLPMLAEALDFVKTTARNGGNFLFVGTKKQASDCVARIAQSVSQSYVTNRWLGGTLTNFTIISRMIKKYKKLKNEESTGENLKYTKREQLELNREMEELEFLIGGISEMVKLPDVLILVDPKKDDTALREARRKGIPVVSLCDTNVNPELITYPIPANDDAVKSIELIMNLLAQSIIEGKTESLKEAPAVVSENQPSSQEKPLDDSPKAVF